ncbi:MAG: HAD family hydrolase [Planctomycetota bacterium]
MHSAILFDLYGTLIELTTDTHPYAALARTLRHQDRTLAINTALTNPNMTLARFAQRCGVSPEEVHAYCAELESDLANVRLFDDVQPTLQALRDRNVKLALVSNLAAPYKQPVQRLGLERYFDVLIYSCDVRVRKPDPRIYEITLGALNCAAKDAAMVGDSFASDVTGPAAIGIKGIHLTRSGRPTQAEHVITTLRELICLTA